MSELSLRSSDRDFIGYGGKPPLANWPNDARVAVSFVLNFEEGAELSIGDGDEKNESVYEAIEEVRAYPDPCMESHFEYGPRSGYWRIMEVLEKYGVPVTISANGRAVERSPWLVQDAANRGHEIACRGFRWERHAGMTEEDERAMIAKSYDRIATHTNTPPVGWHTRSAASTCTRHLLMEHGGFLYDSDAYNDDLPYIHTNPAGRHVILPYAFDTNDMRFQPGGGFVHASDFTRYCSDAFDCLWQEGRRAPKMLSIGLHLRIIGRPARISGLEEVLKHIKTRGGVWYGRRADIAHHWREVSGLPAWHSTA